MTRWSIRVARVASTVVLGLAAAGVAFATPGSGVDGLIQGRGLADEKVKTRGSQPYDVVFQTITIAPRGHTGWHTHHGIAVALVTSGALTIYDGDDESCSPRSYGTNQVYVDPGYGHVHIGRNESAEDATEILVMYLDVPLSEASVRIDAPNPGNCSFAN